MKSFPWPFLLLLFFFFFFFFFFGQIQKESEFKRRKRLRKKKVSAYSIDFQTLFNSQYTYPESSTLFNILDVFGKEFCYGFFV